MKVRLNKLHEKTTNNFKINECEIEMDIPKYNSKNELSIIGNIEELEITQQHQKNRITSRLGLEIEEYDEVIINVPKNKKIDTPILIDYTLEKEEAIYDKITIHYEENSECDFFITYISKDEENHIHHLIENTKSDKNSKGTITYINLMNEKSTNMISIENEVMENANIIHNIMDLGGKTRIYNVYSNLIEKKAQNELNTIYIGKEDSLIDMNYYLKNTKEETKNVMHVEGVLSDHSKKTFRGIIDFVKGCENSIGEENENCILLSDTAISKSLPELLCGEENVVGSHGVSTGKVSQEKCFYLMSRGYSKKDAEKIIVLGNFSKILNTIQDKEIKKFIESNIEELLSY